MKIVKQTKLVEKLYRTIEFIRSYPQIVWNNINSGGIILRWTGPDRVTTTYLNALWSVLFVVIISFVVGLILGAIAAAIFLAVLYLEYRFVFRKYHRKGTWKDFVKYKTESDNCVVETRGGNIKITDFLEAFETGSNFFNPMLKNIKETCFKKTGLYEIGEILRPAAKWLVKVGLVKMTKIAGVRIGVVSLDALLAIGLKQRALNLVTTNLANLELAVYEYSRMKFWFNLVLLANIGFFTVSGASLLIGSIALTVMGFGPNTIVISRWAQLSFGTAVASLSAYAGGQFIPPVDCLPFARYMGDENEATGLTEGRIYVINPGEDLCDSANLPPRMPDIGVDFSNGQETAVADLPTLGSLESQNSCPAPAPRPGSLRGSRAKPPTKSYSDLVRENSPQFEDAPLVRPKRQQRSIYEELKEHFRQLENDPPLL